MSSLLSLPKELLLLILEALANGKRAPCRPWVLHRGSSDWLSLATTCCFLYKLARDTPTLWARIDVTKELRWLELSLERSDNLPLDVMVHDPSAVQGTVERVQAHASRIRGLVVVQADDYTSTTLTPLLSIPLPSLEVLQINTSGRIEGYSPMEDEEITLDTHLFPRLHTVHVGHLPFDWDSTCLPQLKRLALEKSYPNIWLHKAQWLEVLGRCQALEHLHIDCSLPYAPYEPDADLAGQVVPLPNLKILNLISNSPREIGSVLAHLRPSAHAQIELYADVMTDDPQGSTTTLLTALPVRLPVLAHATSASIGGFLFFECAAEGPNPGRIQLFCDPDSEEWETYTSTPERALADVRALLSGAPLTKLSLALAIPYMRPWRQAAYAALFQAFPTLRELDFTGDGVDNMLDLAVPTIAVCEGYFLSALLALDGADASAPPSERRYVLPHLQVLSLRNMQWHDRLLEHLEAVLGPSGRGGVGLRLARLYIAAYERVVDAGSVAAHEAGLARLRLLVTGETSYQDVER
ncbi:hypothetical protein C8Q80DRAFT_1266751 [Daedaleopsis nitida]|nr:hypothetical protein C8Q80DRAFT_1266751 [Daedaleopsis nitida]